MHSQSSPSFAFEAMWVRSGTCFPQDLARY